MPSTAAPAASVPIRLPWTVFPVEVKLRMAIPVFPLPLMTLPAPGAVPPMVLPLEDWTTMPLAPLPRAAVPAALVPM